MFGSKTWEIELQKELANTEVIKKSLIKCERRVKIEENRHAERLKLFQIQKNHADKKTKLQKEEHEAAIAQISEEAKRHTEEHMILVQQLQLDAKRHTKEHAALVQRLQLDAKREHVTIVQQLQFDAKQEREMLESQYDTVLERLEESFAIRTKALEQKYERSLPLVATPDTQMPERADPEVGIDSLGLIEQHNTILRELESEQARLAEEIDAETMDHEKSSSEELLKARHNMSQLEGLLDEANLTEYLL
jgi:hypothetical protein